MYENVFLVYEPESGIKQHKTPHGGVFFLDSNL